MGEYAKRFSDGQRVKVGTCENMYYCRWSQRNDTDYDWKSCKAAFCWRLPIPDEDGIEVGSYDSHTILHYCKDLDMSFIPYDAMLKNVASWADELSTGLVQMVNERLGLLCNVTCYHGLKLNESNEDVKFFWNGKRDALYMNGVWNHPTELRIGLTCAACGKSWSMDFNEAEPVICSLRMKLRLFHECTEYWYEHNEGDKCPYTVRAKSFNNTELRLESSRSEYVIYRGSEDYPATLWEDALYGFVTMLPDYSVRDMGDSDWDNLCAQGESLKLALGIIKQN